MVGLKSVHDSDRIRRVVHVRVTFSWGEGGRNVIPVVVVHFVVKVHIHRV